MLTVLIATAVLTSKPTCCQAMVELTKDPAFVALHVAPVQMDFTPKSGHMAKVGGMNAFLVPAKKGSKGAVIMIHEWWGLNNQIKSTAEKLHEATGYGVVAVDLYGGKMTANPQQATQLVQQVNETLAREQLRETVTAILQRHVLGNSVTKVGTIGYCFGGGYSLQAALDEGKKISACVMYYGHPELNLNRLAGLQAPVLGIFGNLDQGITPELVTQFMEAMKQAHKHLTVYRYNAVHGFANPSNPKYDPASTADAWKRTLAFYRKNLATY